MLTPQARALFADTKTGCIDDITNDFAARHIDRLLDVDQATTDRLSAELGHYDNPDQAPADEPIFITQGTTDRDVPEVATDGLVTHLCALDDRVEYKRYPGLDHNNLVAGSQPDVNEWIAARFAHRAAPTTCPPAP